MFELYRPSSSPDPASPYAVYPASLFALGLGYALWYPEPHDTGESQIGDVGYAHEGAFIRIFNINGSKPEHQVAFWHAPFTITDPLPEPENVFRVDRRHRPISDGPYHSRGVQQREMRGSISTAAFADTAAALSAGYTCKETYGALLVLQSQGYSETVFSNRKLKAYMIRQHEQWCTYLRDDLGQDISPDDVFLVSGWVKTSADWAAMAFSSFVSKHYASVQGQAGRFVGLELFRSRTRVQSGPKLHRQGSIYPRKEGTNPADLDQDQSIFLKRYKLKRRFIILKTIVAGAGYDRLPDHRHGLDGDIASVAGDRASDADMEDSDEDGLHWLQTKTVDPLDVLLEFILEVSDVDIAIARDDDIEGIIGAEEWPLDFATYLRKVQPPVDVEDRCGTISIPKLLARERVQRLERRYITAADLHNWPQISYDAAGIPSIAPVRLTDDPDSSPNFPTKWPYVEFPDPSAPSDALVITPFASSPDGKFLAAVDGALSIVVWRLLDGLVVRRFREQGHTAPICAIAFSPNSRTLISGSADKTAFVWSMESERPIFRLEGHRTAVDNVTYNADGSLIVTASASDSTLKFWNANDGLPMCTFRSLQWRIEGLLLCQDSSRIAVRTQKSVALYEAGSHGPIVQLGIIQPARSDSITAVALSPDGDRLFVCDRTNDARIYSVDTCKPLIQLDRDLLQGSGPVVSAAFSLSGGKLAAVTNVVGVDIYSSTQRDGRPQSAIDVDLAATAVAFSPNGAFLAAAGGIDGSHIWVWNWPSKEFIADFTAPVSEIKDIRFLPDNRRLLTFAKGGPGCLWNFADVLRLR